MRNLNATILTCVEAKKNSVNRNVLSYNDVFDIIMPKESGGKIYVSDIDIVVDMVAVFDDKSNTDMYIEKDKIYDCMIAVTFDGGDYKGIGEFTFNTDSSKLLKCGDRYFCNTTLLIKEQTFEIPENVNQCDLVLLIKHPPQKSQSKWVLQTIKRLFINKLSQ